MAENKVTIIKMPAALIGKSDVIFQIEKDGHKLGDLRISKGTLFWRPTNKQYGFYLNWQDFADLISSEGKRGKYKF